MVVSRAINLETSQRFVDSSNSQRHQGKGYAHLVRHGGEGGLAVCGAVGHGALDGDASGQLGAGPGAVSLTQHRAPPHHREPSLALIVDLNKTGDCQISEYLAEMKRIYFPESRCCFRI